MVWWMTIIYIFMGLIVLAIIIRFVTRKSQNNYGSLDNKLSNIKSKFSDVCKEIKNMVGC